MLPLDRLCQNSNLMKLFAVRGAISVESNTRDAILKATERMMSELLMSNQLNHDQLVSCIFTVTDDLDAEFPAVAARQLGITQVPLLCTQEIPVRNAPKGIIRVLIHYYAPAEHTPQPAYLDKAKTLRLDLAEESGQG